MFGSDLIKKVVGGLLNRLTIKLCTTGLKLKPIHDLYRLGSEYGGYWVPVQNGIKDFDAFVSLGLGRDISFDLELLNLGLPGLGVDPIASYVVEALEKIQNSPNSNNYHTKVAAITPLGNDLILFPPSSGDSWRSEKGVQNKEENHGITFPGISLEDLLLSTSMNYENIILKMDIEGIEVEVLEHTKLGNSLVGYLLVEFDYLSQIPFRNFQRRYFAIKKVRKLIRKLKLQGLFLEKIDEFNFGFSRRSS